jgi:hypothetical protein
LQSFYFTCTHLHSVVFVVLLGPIL